MSPVEVKQLDRLLDVREKLIPVLNTELWKRLGYNEKQSNYTQEVVDLIENEGVFRTHKKRPRLDFSNGEGDKSLYLSQEEGTFKLLAIRDESFAAPARTWEERLMAALKGNSVVVFEHMEYSVAELTLLDESVENLNGLVTKIIGNETQALFGLLPENSVSRLGLSLGVNGVHVSHWTDIGQREFYAQVRVPENERCQLSAAHQVYRNVGNIDEYNLWGKAANVQGPREKIKQREELKWSLSNLQMAGV